LGKKNKSGNDGGSLFFTKDLPVSVDWGGETENLTDVQKWFWAVGRGKKQTGKEKGYRRGESYISLRIRARESGTNKSIRALQSSKKKRFSGN